MPCCLLTVMAFFPRIALILMWLGGYGARAFDTVLWPVLGFLLMPFTTCAYAIAQNETGGVRGWTLLLLVVAIVLDLANLGGGGYETRRRRVVVVQER